VQAGRIEGGCGPVLAILNDAGDDHPVQAVATKP
jgi:hypothetical protein